MSSTEQWQAAYLDVGHGVGVTDGGRFFRCRPGARLGEVLAAVPGGVRRLYLCSELPHLDGDVASDDLMGAADHGDDAAAGDAVSACGEDDAGVWDDPVPAGGAPSAYLQWCLDDPGMVYPEWQPDPEHPHHLDTSHAASCVLRFRHAPDGRQLDACSIGGWFGDALAASCTPEAARDACAWLTRHIAYAFDGAALLGSAGQTGLHAWRHCAEQPGQDGWPLLERYPVLPDEVRERLHHTAGQGRIELFPPPPALPSPALAAGATDGLPVMLPQLSYYDGRLMYAASLAGLGVGPVTHDERPDLAPYRPAWYRVRFTVPRDWRHPGLLPLQVAGTRRGWAWPSEPGAVGETWASDREVLLACWPFPFACRDCAAGYRGGGLPCPLYGWRVQIRERLLFTPEEKPLDTWKDKLLALRDEAERDVAAGYLSARVGELVIAALRGVLVNGLGSFHSSRHAMTRHVRKGEGDAIPAGVRNLLPLPGGGYLWNETHKQPVDPDFTHPEWSVQVWGRCRARMLLAHYAPGSATWTGMLALPPGSVVACKTDGLYLAGDPGWPDDSRPGRLRRKGQLAGPILWPQDWAALADLKRQLDAQKDAWMGADTANEEEPR